MKLGIDFSTCFSFAAICIGDDEQDININTANMVRTGSIIKASIENNQYNILNLKKITKKTHPLVGNDEKVYDKKIGGIPTIFYYDAENGEEFGAAADKLMDTKPHNGVINIKSDLREGNPENKTYTLDGKIYKAEEIVVKILVYLIDNAIKTLKYDYPAVYAAKSDIENLVIAVPAKSDDSYREFIKNCAVKAAKQFNPLTEDDIELIDEPVAAALSYLINNDLKITNGYRILTYDLGGGTFDVAIVQCDLTQRQAFTVLLQDGDIKLGGNNWDNNLANYIKGENPDLTLIDGEERKFMKAVVEKKIILTDDTNVEFISLAKTNKREYFQHNLTRKIFEDETFDLLEQTADIINNVIQEYNLKASTLNAVVLSGGASRMPMVLNRLKFMFPEFSDDKFEYERPDRAIAFGAAIYAENLDIIVPVSPHTYGIWCKALKTGEERINNILFKGTEIRQQKDGKQYIKGYTRSYNPTESYATELPIHIYETDEPVGNDLIEIRELKPKFKFSIPIKPAYNQSGIIPTTQRSYNVEFRLIRGGILEVHVYDNDLNEWAKVKKCRL